MKGNTADPVGKTGRRTWCRHVGESTGADGRIRAVLGIPKKKDLHPHLDRERLQTGGLATPSRRLKNVPEYIMRIGAKDPVFAPNYTIKCLYWQNKVLGEHIRPIFYYQKIQYWCQRSSEAAKRSSEAIFVIQ